MDEKIVYWKNDSMKCKNLSRTESLEIRKSTNYGNVLVKLLVFDENGNSFISIPFYQDHNEKVVRDVRSVARVLKGLEEIGFYTEKQCGMFMNKLYSYVQKVYKYEIERVEKEVDEEIEEIEEKKYEVEEIYGDIESLLDDTKELQT